MHSFVASKKLTWYHLIWTACISETRQDRTKVSFATKSIED